MTAPADKTTLARNTVYSVAGHLVSTALPVLLIPYIIWRIPLADYAVWVALSIAGMWLSRWDLGIWAALPREVADRRARGDAEGLRSVAVTAGLYDLIAGVAVLGVTAALGAAVLPILVPEADPARTYPVLLLVAAQSVVAPVLRHLVQGLSGMQRLDLTQKMAVPVSLAAAGSVVVFLELGWGILGLAASAAFFAVLQLPILAVLLVRAGYPRGFRLAHFRPDVLGGLIRFGWKLEANQIVLQAFRSDRLILLMTGFPRELVARYQFGAVVPDRLSTSVAVLSSAVLPAASDLAARGDEERVRFLLMRGTKYHALAAAGLLGFAALFGHEMIVLWLGRAFPEAAAVLRILALGFGLSAVASCAQAIASALGRPGLQLGTSLAGLAMTVLLYIPAGGRYDYGHLAWAVSSGLALAQVAFMIGFRKVMVFRWREFAGNALLKPAVLALPLLAAWAAWRAVAPHVAPVETRAQAAAVLGPAFAASLLLGWFLARACKVLDDYDLGVLKSVARRLPA
jgi:O-antigen/teichoic acid export membrane protein